MIESALDFPVYSIKAVAHMAGITEPTLRAWEKRYNILAPQRTESGHRRYTKRDIYRIIWLKHRLEEGMSISQASTLLLTQSETNLLDSLPLELKTTPKGRKTNGRRSPNAAIEATQNNEVRSLAVLIQELLKSFLDFDELRADQLIAEAIGLYSPEAVCIDIIQPVLIEIGQLWMLNETTVATEHFASNICRTRLNSMLDSLPIVKDGPLLLTACGPYEFHEIGIIITTLFLRRHGRRVIHLGQNVPAVDLEKDLRRLKPTLVIFSAARTESALMLNQEIKPTIEQVRANFLPELIFAYGGRAFIEEPTLHTLFAGHTYFGDDARQSVALVDQLLPR
ncbi:MAG: MerR family transcriptional regulator [Chloroflexota bacterium]|nr:MerR family transcriptional regulator [Chloroflexota bacterium]